jgi:predicted membrane protein
MEDRNQCPWPSPPDPNGGSVTPGLVLGLAIIAIGVLFLLDNFGFPVGMLWSYWPVILVAVGLAKLVDARDHSGRSAGAILMIVGLIFLADKIHLPFLNGINLWSLWPLAIIAVGAVMLWGALDGNRGYRSGRSPMDRNPFGGKPFGGRPFGQHPLGPDALGHDPIGQPPVDDNPPDPNQRTSWNPGGWTQAPEGELRLLALFGGGKRRVQGDFKGGDMLAMFGGYEVDLRNATMSGDQVVINANAIFGGFEIKVPETWSVIMQITGMFGGHEDSTRVPDPRLVPNPKRLIVRGVTVFGGLSVKN